MDDSFFDDENDKGKAGLRSIVEVPSEKSQPSSAASTARSQKSDGGDTLSPSQDEDDTHTDDRSDGVDLTPEEETPPSSGRSSARKKRKAKNGKYPVNMTPPDKLLKKSEKKAKRYMREKQTDKAIPELTRCCALARIVHGDSHWKHARAHVNLAEGYMNLKNYYAQAEYHTDIAKKMVVNNMQFSSSNTEKTHVLLMMMNLYYIMGRAACQLKKYVDAETLLSKAEKLANERAKISTVSDDEIDEWDIKIYTALAKLHARQQKQALSTEYFAKALEVIEDKYGKDAEELIPIYQGLGTVEQSRGKHADHEKAIEHFLQAHSIASKHNDDGSLELADTAKALAMAYSSVGDEDAETSAESYLNECLATYQSVHGPMHEVTIGVQDELARIMIRTERPEEAISLLRKTLEDKNEVYGEVSSEVAETWKLIGSIHLSKGDTEKALRSLKKCHNVECMHYGANHKKSKDTQRTMDLILANPHIAAKQKKTKEDALKERPRFNNVITSTSALGGFKSPAY